MPYRPPVAMHLKITLPAIAPPPSSGRPSKNHARRPSLEDESAFCHGLSLIAGATTLAATPTPQNTSRVMIQSGSSTSLYEPRGLAKRMEWPLSASITSAIQSARPPSAVQVRPSSPPHTMMKKSTSRKGLHHSSSTRDLQPLTFAPSLEPLQQSPSAVPEFNLNQSPPPPLPMDQPTPFYLAPLMIDQVMHEEVIDEEMMEAQSSRSIEVRLEAMKLSPKSSIRSPLLAALSHPPELPPSPKMIASSLPRRLQPFITPIRVGANGSNETSPTSSIRSSISRRSSCSMFPNEFSSSGSSRHSFASGNSSLAVSRTQSPGPMSGVITTSSSGSDSSADESFGW